jgi:hypothetical protein
MMRHAAVIAVALCSSASPLSAQAARFTVTDERVSVHKGPSTINPVIGTALQGAVLEVTRELGSWVKIVWTPSEDGVGYVHVSKGSVRRGGTASANGDFLIPPRPPVRTAPRASFTPAAPAGGTAVLAEERGPGSTPPAAAGYVARPTHIVGFGASSHGPSLNVGATARAWSARAFGLQLNMSRESAGTGAGQRVTSTQLTPSVLYSLPSRVTDYLWMRPYVGAGASLQHNTRRDVTASVDARRSENRLGFQTFGGGELTFAAAPRFSVSADLGYRWYPTSFTGTEPGGLGVSLSAHWYVK